MDQSIVTALNAPLPRNAIKNRTQAGAKLDYVEGWYVIQKANEIFGFNGWTTSIISLDQQVLEPYQRNGRDMFRCTYTCLMSMSALDVTHQDVGTGTGFSPSSGDAIEGAAKEAVTDALKRCARHWGNQFGLALYDKEQEGVESTTPTAPPVADTSKTGSTGADNGEHKFLSECKSQKERIGDYLYRRTINEFKVKSATEIITLDDRTKLIERLSKLPALYSEAGANIEIGRLVAENHKVGEIVKGRNCKTDDERRVMIHEARTFVKRNESVAA